MAERAAPTANAPMIGLVREKVFIAITNPSPGAAITFSLGTRTFFRLIPAVLDARWPSFGMCRPTVTPSQSRSTRNAQIPWCCDFGSTVAKMLM